MDVDVGEAPHRSSASVVIVLLVTILPLGRAHDAVTDEPGDLAAHTGPYDLLLVGELPQALSGAGVVLAIAVVNGAYQIVPLCGVEDDATGISEAPMKLSV